jgi:hypothetical protein
MRSPVGHFPALLAGLALSAAAPALADTGIVTIGDFGVGGEKQRSMGAAVELFAGTRQVDALVTLGDNDYTGKPTEFRANWLGSFGWAAADGLLVAGTLGNHDVELREGRYERELLGMPRRHYRRRVGDVALFLVDSTRLWKRQASWLDSALARSDAPWKVVAMHHPAFSCGGYLGTPEVRQRFVPIFAQHGVDLVLAAHDHSYQRFAKRKGVTYVVHGGGGARLHSLRSCPSQFPRRVSAREAHGWLYLLAGPGSLRVQAVGRRGRVRDDFELYP